jgi:hypothetical protein
MGQVHRTGHILAGVRTAATPPFIEYYQGKTAHIPYLVTFARAVFYDSPKSIVRDKRLFPGESMADGTSTVPGGRRVGGLDTVVGHILYTYCKREPVHEET